MVNWVSKNCWAKWCVKIWWEALLKILLIEERGAEHGSGSGWGEETNCVFAEENVYSPFV